MQENIYILENIHSENESTICRTPKALTEIFIALDNTFFISRSTPHAAISVMSIENTFLKTTNRFHFF